MYNKNYFDIDLVNARDTIFTKKIILKIETNLEISDNNIENRRKLNKSNLQSILRLVKLPYQKVILDLINDEIFKTLINNVGLNIGCYTMFLTSLSVLLNNFNMLIYPHSEKELFILFKTFYQQQKRIKTLLARKVEFNIKDEKLNNYITLAHYLDELLDESFNMLGNIYIVEYLNYINWKDYNLYFRSNNTSSFSDKLLSEISLNAKITCLEMKSFDFNHLNSYNNARIKLLINELSKSSLHFKITSTELSQKQKTSIKNYSITLMNWQSLKIT